MFSLHMASLLEFSCSMGLAALALHLMTSKGSHWWENDWAMGKKRHRDTELPGVNRTEKTSSTTTTTESRKCHVLSKFSFSFAILVRLTTVRSISNLRGAPVGKLRRPGPLTKSPALNWSRNCVTTDFSENLFLLSHLEGTVILLKIPLQFAPKFGASSHSVQRGFCTVNHSCKSVLGLFPNPASFFNATFLIAA